MIKAVLFDYDGTIMDTNEIILKSWRHLYMQILGRECRDEEVTNSFGEVLRDTLIERFPDYDADELIAIYRNFQQDFFIDELKIFPGMKEMILALKNRGYLTAIVTSRVSAPTWNGLKKFGLENAFDAVVSCDDTDAHKPSPVPCQIALEKLGVDPSEAIMLGDSKYDIQCAHNAGVKAVLVNWTICTPQSERVGISKPDYIIDTASELFDII